MDREKEEKGQAKDSDQELNGIVFKNLYIIFSHRGSRYHREAVFANITEETNSIAGGKPFSGAFIHNLCPRLTLASLNIELYHHY